MEPIRRPSALATDVAHGISARGFHIVADAFDPKLVAALQADARALWEAEDYRAARVGAGDAVRLATAIRSDRIRWFEPDDLSPAQTRWYAELEGLRLSLNRTTFLGLFEWEGHYACYPEGAYYRRHLDVFATARERQVTTLLYLNEDWEPGDGGELRLWTEPSGPNWSPESPSILVEPRAGTFVCFLSEDFFHQVEPAHRERFSLTGWFRTRPA